MHRHSISIFTATLFISSICFFGPSHARPELPEDELPGMIIEPDKPDRREPDIDAVHAPDDYLDDSDDSVEADESRADLAPDCPEYDLKPVNIILWKVYKQRATNGAAAETKMQQMKRQCQPNTGSERAYCLTKKITNALYEQAGI